MTPEEALIKELQVENELLKMRLQKIKIFITDLKNRSEQYNSFTTRFTAVSIKHILDYIKILEK